MAFKFLLKEFSKTFCINLCPAVGSDWKTKIQQQPTRRLERKYGRKSKNGRRKSHRRMGQKQAVPCFVYTLYPLHLSFSISHARLQTYHHQLMCVYKLIRFMRKKAQTNLCLRIAFIFAYFLLCMRGRRMVGRRP